MTLPHYLRHPGPVPGSTGRQSAKLERLVSDSRHGGSRDEPGMTMGVRMALGFETSAGTTI